MNRYIIIGLFTAIVLMMGVSYYRTTNGTIIKTERFIPHTYASLSQADREGISHQEYVQAVSWYEHLPDAITEKITYLSDGLAVVGLIMRPKIENNKKCPAIIYCRGGAYDDGKVIVSTLEKRIYGLVQAGYAVFMPQYRGNDGGQGRDELAGADVHDVCALYDSAKTLAYIDQKNIFMIGYSRGAMDMFQAIKAGKKPNAIVSIAGITDLGAFHNERPDIVDFLISIIPHQPQNLDQEYQKRSVMFWVKEVQIPTLLLHGDADTIVSMSHGKRLAHALQAQGTAHDFKVYKACDHHLKTCSNDMIKDIVQWFDRYLNYPCSMTDT